MFHAFDNGYCTEDNLLAMIMSGFKFITRIENDIQWISPLIDQYRDELSFCGEIMHCDPKFSGVTSMQMHTFQYARQRGSEKSGLSKGETEEITRRLYVHIYFSSTKKADEDLRSSLHSRLNYNVEMLPTVYRPLKSKRKTWDVSTIHPRFW